MIIHLQLMSFFKTDEISRYDFFFQFMKLLFMIFFNSLITSNKNLKWQEKKSLGSTLKIKNSRWLLLNQVEQNKLIIAVFL